MKRSLIIRHLAAVGIILDMGPGIRLVSKTGYVTGNAPSNLTMPSANCQHEAHTEAEGRQIWKLVAALRKILSC